MAPLIAWFVLPGGVAFLAAAYAVLTYYSDSNLGPLAAMFLFLPFGLLGLLTGGILRLLRPSAKVELLTFFVACAASGVGAFCSIMPGPDAKGLVIDALVQQCRPAEEIADAAIRAWELRLANIQGRRIEPDWKNRARQVVRDDRAVVFDMLVLRTKTIAEGRAAWNRGKTLSLGWQDSNQVVSYYARFTQGLCKDYPVGFRTLYYTSPFVVFVGTLDSPRWPTGAIPEFLAAQFRPRIANRYSKEGGLILEPIPEEYRSLVY